MKFLSQINVNTEYTLPMVDGTNGQVLSTDGNGVTYWGTISAGSLTLDGLSDVIITSPSSDQMLRYGLRQGDTVPVWHNFTPNFLTPSSSIDSLGDVTITTAATGQLLRYNGSAWVNWTPNFLTSLPAHTHNDIYYTESEIDSLFAGDTEIDGYNRGAWDVAYNDKINSASFSTTTGVLTLTQQDTGTVTVDLDGRYLQSYTETDPTVPSHVKNITATNISNWNDASNDSIRSASFNTANGVLTLTQVDLGTVTVDLDGRYITSETDSQTLTWTKATSSLTISNGNSVTLEGLATEEYVTSQGYLTSLPAHNHDSRYYTETESDSRFYLATNPNGYITSSGNTSGYSASLSSDDNRTISPSEAGASQLRFGFTSWTNNNASPWADYLHLRSYSDSSGGSDNLVMFKKTGGIGMRIWQQTWGSATAYSSYVDVWTTGDFSSTDISNWNTAYGWGDHAAAGYLTSFSYTETDTLSSVTGRGGSTGSPVVMYGKVTLGNNSSGTYSGNTTGLTLNSTAEVRSTGVQNPPALTWHYEGLATRHLLMTSAGAFNFVSPSNEASGVAVVQVNGNTVWHAGNLTNLNQLTNGPGYLTSLPAHNHDDRYYTETESDSRYVNASGDTMSGSLSFDAAAVIKKKITGVGDNPVKTASGVLASRSDNGGGATYYIIETNVPQDDYQMGGFTIELFGNYGDTNSKTKIDLGGYWNTEANGGFMGFEAHGTNPQYKPTIQVARNNNTGNTAFIISGVSWSYPVIVARDLWLGYSQTDGGSYGEGWVIASANNLDSYSNRDTVVWRNGYSDSNPAGYITGYTETDTLDTVLARGTSTTRTAEFYQTSNTFVNTVAAGNRGLTVFQNTAGADAYMTFHISGDYAGYFGLGGAENDLVWGGWSVGNARHRILHSGNFTDNSANWNTAYNDRISSAAVTGTTTKTLTLTQGDGGTVTATWTDYDTDTDAQQLTWDKPSTTLSISNGNSVALEGLATEEFVTGQGYITGDYLPLTGGTLSGTLTMGTTGTQYIRMGRFPAGTTNTGEAWIGRASDRNTGTMTVQLGGNSASSRSFEVVDYAWSVVLFSVDSSGNLTTHGTITENSSIRYKKDVVDIESTSSKVQLLRPVKYKKIRDESEEIGLIAEDVAELFPEVVKYDNEGRPDGINYSRLSVILLKAVQELTERVNKLENK